MKQYNLYPNKDNDGHVIYEFDQNGILKAFRLEKEMDREQFQNFCKLLPYSEVDFNQMISDWTSRKISFKLIEIPLDLSFTRFYNLYATFGGEKRNRIRAERAWERLSQGDKSKALLYIKRYSESCKQRTIAMKYPDTFLINKQWLD